LSFAYFMFSVLSTAVTEAISRFLGMRARMLERWLKNIFASPQGGAGQYPEFMKTPLMKALLVSTGRLKLTGAPTGPAETTRPPSYIPSTHFVAAALNAGRGADSALDTSLGAWTAVGQDLTGLRGSVVGDSLRELYDRASGDALQFRRDAEAWFDDEMERLSGVYRRWSQALVWGIGLAIVLALNANTLRMAETLWNDAAKREAVATAAGSASGHETVAKATSDINALPLPLGWSQGYHHFWSWVWAVFGALLTLGAISLGAPFWFDTLSKVARIRSTGTPPPASDATRRGDSDQTRTLPDVSNWSPKESGSRQAPEDHGILESGA
jgi:hypothetical protein